MSLTPQNYRQVAEQFLQNLPSKLDYSGDGIVTVAGGFRYLQNLYLNLHQLRHVGCSLSVECFYLGDKEFDECINEVFAGLNVKFIDAHKIEKLGGFQTKSLAIKHSSFERCLFLDADNIVLHDPTYLLDYGFTLWPDSGIFSHDLFGLNTKGRPECESGQIVINKVQSRVCMELFVWMNQNSSFFYRHFYGDKETYQLAALTINEDFVMMPKSKSHRAHRAFTQVGYHGEDLFFHSNNIKLKDNLDVLQNYPNSFFLTTKALEFRDKILSYLQLKNKFYTVSWRI